MSHARVGMVSHWYDPERGSAALPGVIARSLVARGHTVDVLTGFPNYPSGTLYPGYRVRPYRRESSGGVTIHRAPLYPSHDARPMHRAANFLSFAAAGALVAPAALRAADAALVFCSPATAAIPALSLRLLRRVPYVLHIQDLWPDSVVSSGFVASSRVGRLERVLQAYCDVIYRHAHTIAVTSPGMAEAVAARGVPESRLAFVPNWADEASFLPAAKDHELAGELGLDAPFVVMYAGNFGEYQALDVLVEAATLLRSHTDIRFALVGSGVEETRLRRMVAERDLANVTFVGPQPFGRMGAILALGDVQVVSLQDRPLFRTTLPSKLQGVLAAGRPVVGALVGDAAAVVRASSAGLVVRPGSATELADAVLNLRTRGGEALGRLGAAGRAYYEAEFSEAVAGGRLSELLDRAAGDRGRR